jgi:hypothetical protein
VLQVRHQTEKHAAGYGRRRQQAVGDGVPWVRAVTEVFVTLFSNERARTLLRDFASAQADAPKRPHAAFARARAPGSEG